jgi:hypothetical protein
MQVVIRSDGLLLVIDHDARLVTLVRTGPGAGPGGAYQATFAELRAMMQQS